VANTSVCYTSQTPCEGFTQVLDFVITHAWDTKTSKSQRAIETLQFVGHNGMGKSIRVPSGRARDILDKAF
jgi:hypothetical protein